jgi:hypothetical protein
MLAAAMLRVCCVPSLFVTIAADPDLDQYSHIYNVILIAPGVLLPFDSSNGPAPGAEYAYARKKKVWPPTRPYKCDATRNAPREVQMLHDAPSRSLRNNVLRRRMRGTRDPVSYSANSHLFHPLQGLHDVNCDADGNCYDTSTGTYTPAAPTISLSDLQASATPGDCAYGVDASGNCLPGTMTLPPSLPLATAATGGPGVTSLLSTALITAAQAASPAIAAASRQSPYYITNPATGQSVLYNPNTGQSSASGIFGTTGAAGSSTILLVGLAALAFLAFKK